jgi:pimeloyl-ACP methyl ester carboxylesterase
MGAYVATALAAQNPELVAGLMLVDGGYVAEITSGPGPNQALDALLTLRVMQLRQTYPSREAYRAFWRTQPHFPPDEWSPWIEAFLDYELGGEAPNLKPKAAEAAVRADLAEGFKRAEITARLQAIRVPVLMLRAESGFGPGHPPLFPDAMANQMRSFVPHMQEQLMPGTTHYTIMLGKRHAPAVAELLNNFAHKCEVDEGEVL